MTTTIRTGPWIGVLGLVTAVAPLATDMYLPALPALAADLHTSATTAQLTLTAFLVGLAAGQLVIGPLSDAWGRRRLLLAGTVLFALAGVACALAPAAPLLVAARFVQGAAGSAGLVLSRAVITDTTSGNRAVRLFALMMAINGIAPVVAPVLGSALFGAVGWRGLFVVLAGLGLVMAAGVLAAVPESLPVEHRHRGGLRRTAGSAGALLRRRAWVGYTLAFGFAFAAMFTYIAGSPFVLQDVLGLSPVQYGVAFGVNAAGLAVTALVAGRLTERIAPHRQLVAGTVALIVLGAALLTAVSLHVPTAATLVLLFLMQCSLGPILGNAAALASAAAQDVAGVGSALLGAWQFGLAAVVSPLSGGDPVRMAAVLTGSAVLAVAGLAVAGRPARAVASPG